MDDGEVLAAKLAQRKQEREEIAARRKAKADARKKEIDRKKHLKRQKKYDDKRRADIIERTRKKKAAKARARLAEPKQQARAEKRKIEVLEAQREFGERAEEIREASRKMLVQRELASRQLARNHLVPFMQRMYPDYRAGWVHKDVARRLEVFSQAVANGESPRLMLQMPPRTGKSLEASTYFPSWHLGHYPNHEIIMSTYSGSLALGFSRKVRGVLREPSYHKLFDTRLDKDNQNAEGWMTNKGGGFVPAGVGGAITGKGAHVLIIDDPVKNSEEAESQTVRQAIKDWYASTAYTRLAPGGGVLIIQTRWHDDDLSGWLETQMIEGEGDEFEIVRYPAIAEEDEEFRYKGEALHPERYDEEALERIKRAVGPRVWAALYQQSPTSDDGGYFTSDMIQFYEEGELPSRLSYYTAWDFAIGKKERNDYTVGLTVGVDAEENMWVVSLVRGRMDTFEMAEAILDQYERYKDNLVGLEKGHIQMALGPYLEQRIKERRLFGFPMHELNPGRRDKELRARPIQGRMRQGRVRFPKNASWIDSLVKELISFPFAAHDDMVDALAWIGLMLQEINVPHVEKPDKPKTWRSKLKQYIRHHEGRKKSAMTA